MKINIFAGARRIAILIGSIAIVGTLIALVIYDPYVPAEYSLAHPNGGFVRMQGLCPVDASRHYFSSKSSKNENVSVTVCLLTMPFGKENSLLIPYKVDERGMTWGAASYTSEISDYKRIIEERFKMSSSDEELLKKEISQNYRKNWFSGLGYLIAGLTIFACFVSAFGWIVRGFLSIPRGMDKRPE